MKRRNVLLGLGASAAGSGIVFGTGAFTQIEADRSLTIGVDEDASALLALDAGDNVASVYNNGNEDGNSGGNGEMVIDTEQLSGGDENEGFNVGATAQIGSTDKSLPDPDSATVSENADDVAFVVTNNFDTVEGGNSNDEIDVTLDLSNVTSGDGDLFFVGTQYDENSNEVTTNVADKDGSDSDEVTTFTLTPNDQIYFIIQIQTGNTTGPSDFTGSVTFSVEPTGS